MSFVRREKMGDEIFAAVGFCLVVKKIFENVIATNADADEEERLGEPSLRLIF